MIKRLVNKIIDDVVKRLLKIRFDIHQIAQNKYELTIYYEGIAVFTQQVNIEIPNK